MLKSLVSLELKLIILINILNSFIQFLEISFLNAFNVPNELKKIAYKLGTNAITGTRFAFVGKDQFYSGTAVIVEDKD
ncbi:MAG: hypothetical protein ACFE9S_14770 [Candidatus Hermodarchaeota archaeon]